MAAAASASVQRSAREEQPATTVVSSSPCPGPNQHPAESAGLTLADAANYPLAQALANSRNSLVSAGNLGFGFAPIAGVGSGLSLAGHPSNSVVGLAAANARSQAQAAALASMAQLDSLRQFPTLNAIQQNLDLNRMLAAANSNQSLLAQQWRLMPHGAYQQPNAAPNFGIFPIATPENISAAGYQLGMIPSNLVQQAGGPSDGLQQALRLAGAGGDKKRKADEVGNREGN